MADHVNRSDGAEPRPVPRAFQLPGETPVVDEDPPPPPDDGPAPEPRPPAPPPPAKRIVTGMVRDPFGVPAAGVTVKAFAERLRTARVQLGAAVQTGLGSTAGTYRIEFPSPQPRFALVIDAQPTGGAVTRSAPMFDPPEAVVVNLSLGGMPAGGDSRFARLSAAVSPALGAGVAPAVVKPEDLPHLAEATGEDPERIAQLAAADRLAGEASALGATVDRTQLRAAFFALLSAGLPIALPDLLACGADAHRHALRTGIDTNLIPGIPDATLEAVVAALDHLARAKALEPTPGAIGALPAIAALPVAAKSTLMATFANHRTDPEGFWAELATKPDLTAAQRDRLRLNLQLNQISRGHKPLVDLVNGSAVAGRPMNLGDLAGFSKTEWVALLGSQQVQKPGDRAPAWVPGATPTDRVNAFADLLQREFEAAMPTAVVGGRAAKDASLPGKANVTAFLANVAANNIPFEIGSTNVDRLRSDAQQGTKAFAGLDADATARQLKAIQRVHKVAPRYDAMSALLKDGKDSAYRITQLGRKAFLARYGASFGAGPDGARDADAAYRRAEQAVATAHVLFGRHSAQLGNPGMPTLPSPPEDVPGIPNWSSLFGAADFCDCPECRSVFGPAAYLVDLLEFLKPRPATTAGKSARDVLLARRPDIGAIELSCDNATIAVPYVDLVNEILEDVVAGPTAHARTTGTAEERAVSPEYVNEPGYTQLANRVFPWVLPFDLGRATAEVFLDHLGVARTELMEAFRPAEASAAGPVEEEVLQEHLGLPTTAWRILTGADGRLANELWGMPIAVGGAGWVTAVAKAREFLGRSGLTFDELSALLSTSVVKTLNKGTIAIQRPASGGSLDDIAITGLTEAALKEIARFLRLRAALGWSIEDTDRALRVLAHPQANRAVQVAELHRLHGEVRRPLAELLTWFGPLDTTPDRPGELSPYDRVFANRATTNPVHPAFALGATRTELANPGGRITAHAAAITAALGITAGDLAALVPRRVPDVLNRANLSALYAHVSLASVLGVAPRELPALIRLAGFDVPFDRRSPGNARAFLERCQKIRHSGFTLDELTYLLTGEARDASGVGAGDEARAALLGELRAGLREVAGADAGRALVTQRLADALGLAEPLARRLATVTIRQPGSQRSAVEPFLDPAFVADTPDDTAALASLDALERAAHVARRLEVSADDVPFVFEAGHGFSFDLNATPSAPAAGRMFRLLVTIDWIRLRDRLTPASTRLFELFEAARRDASSEAVLGDISAATGWSLADLKRVHGDLADEADWLRIERGFALLEKLGVTADRAHAWAGPDISLHEARTVEQAAKAHHDERSWREVARPLRDRLRERQRAALAAAVRQSTGLPDNDALYGHLLVDPEMSACQPTSRIRLAIASVQLFVQRCLAGLEPQVKLDDEAARAWEYLERYRVWEANRKVFLYPENFLRPELRTDKTPLFVELENRLAQREITDESVTDAFIAYADGLEEVARLDIRGAYHEIEERAGEQTDVLHVIGRTFGTPPIYHYRRRVDSTHWTAWEKVDADIDGDHLIPVVYDGRLFLFWPVFGERSLPPGPDDEPRSQTTLKLAWTERKGDTWLAKRVTAGGWLSDPDAVVDPRAIWLRAVTGDRDLIIRFGTEHGPLGEFAGGAGNGDLVPRAYSDPADFGRALVVPPRTRVDAMGFAELTPPQVEASPTAGYRAGRGTKPRIAVPDPVPGRPTGTSVVPPDDSLYLPVAQAARIGKPAAARVLAATPGTFALTPLHQHGPFDDGDVFFYADAGRTFLVTPQRAHRYDWSLPHRVDLATPAVPATYFTTLAPALDRAVPFTLAPAPAPAAAPPPGSGEASTVVRSERLTFPGVRKVDNLVSSNRRGYRILTDTAPASPVVIPPGRSDTVFSFESLQHPYASEFLRRLRGGGTAALLGWTVDAEATQMLRADFFASTYEPQAGLIAGPIPVDEVDFSFGGAYSAHNWELFFHAPLLVADRLAENHRHADAERWLHYLFDPRDGAPGPAPQRFWKVKPLRDAAAGAAEQDLRRMLGLLTDEGGDAATRTARAELRAQIAAWRRDPFDPDAVATLRVSAYQKTVVMRYVDNLLDWGDQLFQQDSGESVAEASMLYLRAAALLGPKPTALPPAGPPPVKSYNQLEGSLDDFSNALVEIENLLPAGPGEPEPATGSGAPITLLRNSLYFSVPPNSKLLGYWDRVADRLFKIRHCQNLDGIVRQLPLFDPPIDPELLLRLGSSATDIAAALGDAAVPLPTYRFQTLLAKAKEFSQDVCALGGMLLSALQNHDAEELAALRQTHELSMLDALRQTKLDQASEAKDLADALVKQAELAKMRKEYSEGLPLMNGFEATGFTMSGLAAVLQTIAEFTELGAAGAYQFPDSEAGVNGPLPTASVRLPGSGDKTGKSAQAIAAKLGRAASGLNLAGSLATAFGSYQRRKDEADHQAALASTELQQIALQKSAADLRYDIAYRDVTLHDTQTSQSREVGELLRDKFTSRELYSWMVGQVGAVYFQAYQLAYELARKAERAFQHELAVTDRFIRFGYWDNLKRGLLAGERLHADLRRMEAAYLDRNVRELEITKHVSLALTDPLALVALKQTGSCFLELPESLFDADFAGHYLRRMKSVALSVPCVTGPYTAVNATLTLLSGTVRRDPSVTGGYARSGPDDPRFTDSLVPVQSIVTSRGLEDSGLFEPNLRDERYMPFEGAGAISRWRLQIPPLTNRFDLRSISDVVLHLHYTARDGGQALHDAVAGEVSEAAGSGAQLFVARHAFVDAWQRFLNPAPDAAVQALELDLGRERFPFQPEGRGVRITGIDLFLRIAGAGSAPLPVELFDDVAAGGADVVVKAPMTVSGGVHHLAVDLPGGRQPGRWVLRVRSDQIPPALARPNSTPRRLDVDRVQDLYVVCRYARA